MTRQKKRPRLWQRKRSAEVLLSQLMWSANYSPLSYERVTCWGLCSVIVMCVDIGLAEAKHSYHAGSVYYVLLNWNRMGSSSNKSKLRLLPCSVGLWVSSPVYWACDRVTLWLIQSLSAFLLHCADICWRGKYCSRACVASAGGAAAAFIAVTQKLTMIDTEIKTRFYLPPQGFQVNVDWWRGWWGHAGNHRQVHGHSAQEVMSSTLLITCWSPKCSSEMFELSSLMRKFDYFNLWLCLLRCLRLSCSQTHDEAPPSYYPLNKCKYPTT